MPRHEVVTYDWCQYQDDVKHGLWTVRKAVKSDDFKVYSQAEAIAYCKEHNK